MVPAQNDSKWSDDEDDDDDDDGKCEWEAVAPAENASGDDDPESSEGEGEEEATPEFIPAASHYLGGALGNGVLEITITKGLQSVPTATKGRNNDILFQELHDCLLILKKTHRPLVKKWLESLATITCLSKQEEPQRAALVEKATALMRKLKQAKKKCRELNIK
jgi:hypothetical protein